jgi:uncharacterized membrane protein YgcG
MKTLIPISAVLMLVSVGGCAPTDVVNTAQIYDPVDAVQPYLQRSDKMTLSGGNAQAVNTVIHTVDPWPRNVGNKRIAGNGQRSADAVYRYRCGKGAGQPLQTISTGSSVSASGGSGGGGGAGGRPGDECGGGTAPK